MSRTKTITTTIALALGLSVFAGATTDAHACGDVFYEPVDHRIQGVARAEKDLAAGKSHLAAASVLRMIPHIRNYEKPTGSDQVLNRAMRVLAVATARNAGNLDLKRRVPMSVAALWTPQDGPLANVAWAANMLEAIGEKNGTSDPILQGELGEALAQLPERQAEGQKLLEELADKDLLPTAEGYRTLATLRGHAGDDKGQTAALQRCRAMAVDAAICGAASS